MTLIYPLYGALGVFIAGNLLRILRMIAMPAHLRWELYPVPGGPRARAGYGGSYLEESEWWTRPIASSVGSELRVILPELFFLKGVWQHHRRLWLWSWLLHIALYLLMSAVGLAVLVAIFERVGTVSSGGMRNAVAAARALTMILSWIAVLSGTTGTFGLIVYRITSPKMRAFTSPAAFFNLSVILSFFLTGLLSLITDSAATGNMISMVGALLTLRAAPGLHGFTAAHTAVLAVFLGYFPFTHMTHMYMKYFTYHKVRWDDAPYLEGGKMSASIARSLNSPVSWSAPHIRGEGKKNWAAVAAEEVSSNEKQPQA
jgi:nitrate reductase gamma subunit